MPGPQRDSLQKRPPYAWRPEVSEGAQRHVSPLVDGHAPSVVSQYVCSQARPKATPLHTHAGVDPLAQVVAYRDVGWQLRVPYTQSAHSQRDADPAHEVPLKGDEQSQAERLARKDAPR